MGMSRGLVRYNCGACPALVVNSGQNAFVLTERVEEWACPAAGQARPWSMSSPERERWT